MLTSDDIAHVCITRGGLAQWERDTMADKPAPDAAAPAATKEDGVASGTADASTGAASNAGGAKLSKAQKRAAKRRAKKAAKKAESAAPGPSGQLTRGKVWACWSLPLYAWVLTMTLRLRS